MRYHNITKDDMLNGDGLRAVLWVAGCGHACPGCHNPVTWDAAGGLPFDGDAREELFRELQKDYVSGVTFSGGDPLFPGNREEVAALAKEIRERFPDKTVWLYTGYKWEQVWGLPAVQLSDVVVDGRFVQEIADPLLLWRGSENQRVIDVRKTCELGQIVLHPEPWDGPILPSSSHYGISYGGTGMETVAKFERVSEPQFLKDWQEKMGGREQEAKTVYAAVRLPRRATAGSAGYDFFAPADLILPPGCSALIPTGIRVRIQAGWLLAIFPRSGLGFKYRLQLDNTVGIVDSDYYGADNEGHMFIKMTNASNEKKTLSVKAGEGFAQGVFLPFGLAQNDCAGGKRHGGFGSTTVNKVDT